MQEDYVHLIKVLSAHYSKRCKSRGKLPSNDVMNSEIVTIVARLMPTIAVYSMDMDSQLGLTNSNGSLKSLLD